MKRILVVDDDLGILDSIKQILELEGYEVDIASTGAEGIDKIESQFYHLALFDIKLPDMDGTDLLDQAQKLRPSMKKIMVTGYASLENSIRSLNSGADAFILKPVEPSALLKKVEEKLAERDHDDQINEQQVSDYLEDKLLGVRR